MNQYNCPTCCDIGVIFEANVSAKVRKIFNDKVKVIFIHPKEENYKLIKCPENCIKSQGEMNVI